MNHGATLPPQKDKCASDKQHVRHKWHDMSILIFFLMDKIYLFTCTLIETLNNRFLRYKDTI